MDKEMIETVAIALSQWRLDLDLGKPKWNDLEEFVKEAYRNQAKAAIESLQQYTQPIREALEDIIEDCYFEKKEWCNKRNINEYREAAKQALSSPLLRGEAVETKVDEL